MAKKFKSGNELAAAFLKASADFQKEVKGILEFNLGEIETTAIRDAPGPGAPIKTKFGNETQDNINKHLSPTPISQAISYKIDTSGYSGSVFIESSAGVIAIYTEFGTGQSAAVYLATLDNEFRAVARRYYINGKGTIIQQAYLLPAYFQYQVQFQKELKQALKNISL